ncbi:hypothetical protein B0J17DRAFT_706556 [Rhizoctonia solani]|nr:hypothetical protein B0J17DRAFT_706556 [Rhizoctonia solani]
MLRKTQLGLKYFDQPNAWPNLFFIVILLRVSIKLAAVLWKLQQAANALLSPVPLSVTLQSNVREPDRNANGPPLNIPAPSPNVTVQTAQPCNNLSAPLSTLLISRLAPVSMRMGQICTQGCPLGIFWRDWEDLDPKNAQQSGIGNASMGVCLKVVLQSVHQVVPAGGAANGGQFLQMADEPDDFTVFSLRLHEEPMPALTITLEIQARPLLPNITGSTPKTVANQSRNQLGPNTSRAVASTLT